MAGGRGWQGSWPVAAAGLAPAASVDAPHALDDGPLGGHDGSGPGSRSAVAVRVREDGDHGRLQVVTVANAGEHLPLISLKLRFQVPRVRQWIGSTCSVSSDCKLLAWLHKYRISFR